VLSAFLGLGLASLAACQEPLATPPAAAYPAPYAAYPPPSASPPPAPVDDWHTARARAVLAFAEAQVGRPYCWGGTGPGCFDCSGLTQRAWAQVGVRLPRTADAYLTQVPEVALSDVRPGDVLWWPGHVGLYAGQGWQVEALNARSGVVMRRAVPPRRAFRPL
jgi:cell wall-associated NlpC family hydrolase